MATSLRIRSLASNSAFGLAWLILSLGAVSRAADSAPPAADAGYHIIGAGITGASQLQPGVGSESKLELRSSDARLTEAFDWAKRQASVYARDAGDPVGPWYEGGEPGRESFCMRDISHQAVGGHALGFARHNLNMLHRFAENIAESRDWCSYWGMTRMNQPRRVDYKDDAHFWYCLPANFDVLAACYRMYLWTGDPAYVSDPVFLNFYDRTVDDYVQRWALDLDRIMTRPRLLNVRGIFDPDDKFQKARGIPGYDEQTKGYVVAADVLATQYAAYNAYVYFQEFLGHEDRARLFAEKAAAVRNLLNTAWWNAADNCFYARVNADHKLEGRDAGVLLYHGVVEDGPKLKAALGAVGVSRTSAEILYRYGEADAAYDRLMAVVFDAGSRREYPEVSFSWIGAFVTGTMGVNVEAPAPLDAWVKGYWVDKIVRTLPGLGSKVAWAELRNLPVRANEIAVRHEGTTKTVMTNLSGPAFIWQACFSGAHETLLVNGQPMKATLEPGWLGATLSSVRVTLGAGGIVTVEVPK
ncbi:MAG TPA: hypothetical protein VFB27_09515 [Opitutaceae bacterium]|nr:hypothetical protein [Opitutaceae bacterium]